jgi:hypothetical protein
LEFTPQELSAILFYNIKDKETEYQFDWEKTRIQTYFLISIQLPKKSKMTYDRFCKQIWPFSWDKNKKGKENPTEGMMDMNQWNKIFNGQTLSS